MSGIHLYSPEGKGPCTERFLGLGESIGNVEEHPIYPEAYQRLQLANLGPIDGLWTTKNAGKLNCSHGGSSLVGATNPEFQSRCERHRQEVEEWLEED